MDPATDRMTGLAAVVAQAQQGNPDAFRVLYRDTQPRLLRYLHALVGDDAEDIASEMDTARAAAVLGKRPGAVRTAAHRGLRTLAHHLQRRDASQAVTHSRNLTLKDMR
jgi:DNA-directed RNA polymerase specialized sigma24 family protein